MTSEALLWSGVFFGAIVVVALVTFWWLNRDPKVERRPSDRIPLFSGAELGVTTPAEASVPTAPVADGVAPVSAGWGLAGPMDPVPPAAQVPLPPTGPPGPLAPPPEGPPVAGAGRPSGRSGASAAEVRAEVRPIAEVPPRVPPPIVGTPVAADGVPGTMVEGHLLRFSVPAEGTLQFLPGRLEIATGLDAGREIRFVRLPGPDGTEVTFGRADGPLYRHVQLRDQTVSRAHARMRLVEGTWMLTNLSRTNPVVHNGRTLPDGAVHPLADGDKVEMGEVVFTFRSR